MNKSYNPLDLLEVFTTNFPEIVNSMKYSDHGNENRLNPYHMEGDVFTHTMMVFKEAITRFPEDKLLHICALLHDIGKPKARSLMFDEKKNITKVRFFGHEGISVFLAIDILNSKAFEFLYLTDEDKIKILNTISLHGEFFGYFNDEKKLTKLIKKFNNNIVDIELLRRQLICDHSGRITLDNTNTTNTTIITNTNDSVSVEEKEHELILLVGPPCSGKTTIYNNNYHNYTYISRDDTLMQYANDNNISGNYSEVFSKLTPDDHNIIDNIVLAKYSKAIKDRENVIIDMTNMSPKSRRKWSNIPKSYKKRAIVFYIGDKKLHERNTIRAREGKYIRHNVFESMYSRFIVPTYDEVDEIYYVL